jgi:plasmid stabilization system protein ParE
MRHSLALLLALACLSCQSAARPRPPGDPAALRYNLSYVREPEHAVDVEVVLVRGTPREFLFTRAGGVDTVQALRESGEARALRVVDGAVAVPPGTRFLRYRYALDSRIRARGPDLYTGVGEGDARHVAGREYLIRPRVVTPDLRVELYVEGVDALLPWAPGEGGLYRLRGEDLVDSGFHGFGGSRCRAELPDAVLEVGIFGRFTHLKDADVCAWLRQSAEEVRTVRQAFPYPRITVRVIPVAGRRSSSLFGMVLWSSPPSISILVGRDAEPGAFARDWVALHELLHLAHPAILPRVPWLSEGLATYYTEVARARSGRQSAERAWQELLDGFARGRRSARGRTMEQVISSGSFSGVYWTGALFALHLDVEIRRVTGNQRRLDDVLELLAKQGTTSTLGAFGAAVDSVAGQPLFDALLARHLPRPAFVELDGLLEALGVTAGSEGVKLVPARDSLLREAVDGRRTRGAAH